MAIPVLDASCCGCCSLRTGSKIVGWLSLIGSVLVLAILIAAEAEIVNSKKVDDKNDVQAVVIFSIICQALVTLAGIAVVYGIHKELPHYMKPWIIINTFNWIIQIIGMVINICYRRFKSEDTGKIIGAAFNVYFLLIVYSYYRRLRDNGNSMNV